MYFKNIFSWVSVLSANNLSIENFITTTLLRKSYLKKLNGLNKNLSRIAYLFFILDDEYERIL
jgi:hypothetical protein